MNLNPGKTEFSDAEHRALRQEIERIKAFESISEAEIARQSEVSAPTLNGYLKGSYNGRNDPVAVKLQRWIDARRIAQSMRRRMPKAPDFLQLPTSREIDNRIHHARALGRMVMVTGVPGASKTATARQYCAANPRAWLATMDPSTRGVPTMLLAVLSAMGITDVRGTPLQLSNRVVAKAMEAEAVLLIDEAQHLSEQAIEQLRAINDKTRQMGQALGIVLIGNEEATAKIGPTGIKPVFAQVSSRIAQRKYIGAPRREDVTELAYAWAHANGEEITVQDVEFLVEVAARPGGLRNVEMTFEGALLAAFGAEEPLCLKHLKGAFGSITDLRA